MPPKACAFTSVCEEDAVWIPQYLEEVDRLGIDFAVHFDRCSGPTKASMESHPRCVGSTKQDDPSIEFDETHKQKVFDLVAGERYKWAMAWDVDETYARNAPGILRELVASDYQLIDIKWVNLWGDPKHIRVDGAFAAGHRVKFYNLSTGQFLFNHPTVNGGKLVGGHCETTRRHDFVCLHWGMMTEEIRVQHKERWDRIYTKAVGANPYGFWNYALSPDYPPTVVENPYL